MLDIKNEVLLAENRIRPFIYETPTLFSLLLSKITNTQIYLKCENLQYTGAFKVRGAFNKILSLTSNQLKQGVVTASSGNHGAGLAFVLNKLKIPGVIFLPENASNAKVANIKNYNVEIKFHATDCIQTELSAIEYAKHHNMTFISAYNDPQIIGGQGTIALELIKQVNKIDAIFVPVGGGGLISGIAGYVKSVSPNTKVIGCLPENSPVMAKSIIAGKIIEVENLPTLADGTAGGIESDSITFEICQKYVDDYILVSEQEIASALVTILSTQHLLVEGAAAVALAALLKNASPFQNKNVVIILSGGNISLDTLRKVLEMQC